MNIFYFLQMHFSEYTLIYRCYRKVEKMVPLNLPKKKKGKNGKSQQFVSVKSLVVRKRCKKTGMSKENKKSGAIKI